MSETEIYYNADSGGRGTTRALFTRREAFVVLNNTSLDKLGLFQMPMDGKAFMDLELAIRALRHDPTERNTFPPGTLFHGFGLITTDAEKTFPAEKLVRLGENRRAGDRTVAAFQWAGGPDPHLEAVAHTLEQLVTEVLRHPEEAIQGLAEWDASRPTGGGGVSVVFRIRNIGKTPVEIVNPASGKTVEDVGLRLNLVTKEIGAESLEFGRGDVLELKADGSPNDAAPLNTVRLEPGHDLALRLRKQVKIRRSSYRGILRFAARSSAGPHERLLTGGLSVELPPSRLGSWLPF